MGFGCGTWDLQSSLQHEGSSSWPGIKLRLPTLGAWNLSRWTTRQVPLRYFNTGLPFPCWWFTFSVLPCSFPITPSVTENCCIWCDFTIRTSLRLFFLMWTLAKVFIEFVTMLLMLFMSWCFGSEACGILTPWSETEPTSPALEGEVLITGSPGKSHHHQDFCCCFLNHRRKDFCPSCRRRHLKWRTTK